MNDDCRALAGSEPPTPRPVGSPGHDNARIYLERRLRELGLVPAFGTDYFLPYFGTFANIAARLPCIGSTSAHAKTILLGAHYDTCGETPGADDNAAAVAIVLETVRQLRLAPIACDILVVFFDAEEPPYFQSEAMGSTRFLVDVLLPAGEDVFPIILDLCGHDVPLPGLEPALFVVGLETDGNARHAFERTNAAEGIVPLPIPNLVLGTDLSDYHAFNERGMPYVFFSCGEWEHYHMPTDTVERLSQNKMACIAVYLEAFVRELHDEQHGSGGSPGPSEGPELPPEPSLGGTTTTERERFTRRALWFEERLGPMLHHVGFPRSGDLETDLRRLRQGLI
jgi:hypothetical protein